MCDIFQNTNIDMLKCSRDYFTKSINRHISRVRSVGGFRIIAACKVTYQVASRTQVRQIVEWIINSQAAYLHNSFFIDKLR